MVFYQAVQTLAQFYLNTKYFVNVEGIENVPQRGAGIVVAKHRATNDIMLLGGFMPRKMHFVAKEDLSTGKGWKGKRNALFMKYMETIPVNRRGNESGVLKKSLYYLNKGDLLAIFPEGSRFKEDIGNPYRDEYLYPFKPLVALLAQKKKVPIIPVGIRGTQQTEWRTTIDMIVGEALWPEKNESRDELTRRTERSVARLSGYKPPLYETK